MENREKKVATTPTAHIECNVLQRIYEKGNVCSGNSCDLRQQKISKFKLLSVKLDYND